MVFFLSESMNSKPVPKAPICSHRILFCSAQGTFDTFPYSVSRYNTAPDEVFGRGLAMQCIDDVISLNGFSDDVSVAVDKAVKPIISSNERCNTLSTLSTIPWWFCPRVTVFKLTHLYRMVFFLSESMNSKQERKKEKRFIILSQFWHYLDLLVSLMGFLPQLTRSGTL
jgi:hypothetical protein